MYLRRNKVQSGGRKKTYVSVAHSIWESSSPGRCPPCSRPLTVVNLGSEEGVDLEVAEELVDALQRCYPRSFGQRGQTPSLVRELVQKIRSHCGAQLKLLCSTRRGLRSEIPDRACRLQFLQSVVAMAHAQAEVEFGLGDAQLCDETALNSQSAHPGPVHHTPQVRTSRRCRDNASISAHRLPCVAMNRFGVTE